jgi:hypothetical protein
MSDYPSTIETARTATACRDEAVSSTRERLDEAFDASSDGLIAGMAFVGAVIVMIGVGLGII